MNTSKYIKAVVGKGGYSVTEPITQWDYGYILQIEGAELPPTYEVDFSNDRYSGEALKVYGDSEGAEIPEELIETGRDIYAFYYFIGDSHGKTAYTCLIPNELRAKRGDKHPTPSQQDSIDRAIVRINKAVAKTEEDAGKAAAAIEHYPKIENDTWHVWDVENEAWVDTGLEPEGTDGVDGYSPTVTVSGNASTGSRTISITDKNGTKVATIYDGLSVVMLNSSFVIPTDAQGILTRDITLRVAFKIRKGNALLGGGIYTSDIVQQDDPSDPLSIQMRRWSYCVRRTDPYTEITLLAGYKMHGDSGTFSITLTTDDKDFVFTPAWSIARQGAKGDPGEPALGMDIHICASGEYDATTRVPTISEPDEHTFYLVPSADSETTELFVEWIYINNAGEKFGSAAIALKRIKDDPAQNGGVIEGDITSNQATGLYSHAEGYSTQATAQGAHAEGTGNVASGDSSHAEGIGNTASARNAHAEGMQTEANAAEAHAEGLGTIASGIASHSEGSGTTASGDYSHAEGANTTASGDYSHAEGIVTTASALEAHAEGAGTTASGNYSHAEGGGTRATAAQSHAEGGATLASGASSHAEGGGTTASGTDAHAEGNGTQANGDHSHAEGYGTTANGSQSHAEGENTVAQGNASHASGTSTIARRKSQFVIG